MSEDCALEGNVLPRGGPLSAERTSRPCGKIANASKAEVCHHAGRDGISFSISRAFSGPVSWTVRLTILRRKALGDMLPRNLRIPKLLIYLFALADLGGLIAQERPNIPPDAISRAKSFVLTHNGDAFLYNYDAG